MSDSSAPISKLIYMDDRGRMFLLRKGAGRAVLAAVAPDSLGLLYFHDAPVMQRQDHRAVANRAQCAHELAQQFGLSGPRRFPGFLSAGDAFYRSRFASFYCQYAISWHGKCPPVMCGLVFPPPRPAPPEKRGIASCASRPV